MSKVIGFIGCGNMGSAMLGGLISSGFQKAEDIIVSTHTEASAKKIEEKFNVKTKASNIEVAEEADVIILAVKPNMYKAIVDEIKPKINGEKLIEIVENV